MVTYDGRVIDHSDPRNITTSEGQSYAMFFALVNNDRTLFNDLLLWTQDNLAGGDLSSNLPAWLWGRKPDGQWGVLDSNAASDSDLWIAYNLLEAGRLWGERQYTIMGNQLLRQIARREITQLPGFGPMLLPAPFGFVRDQIWRLNPSYLPPQIIARLAEEQSILWRDLSDVLPRFLTETSPIGIAPDWISWVASENENGAFRSLTERDALGSYDAIRVYLWIGMLDDAYAPAKALKRHVSAIGKYVNEQGRVAEKINIHTGASESFGGPGFSAALLPLFTGQPLETQLLANLKNAASSELGYYNQMLSLFGLGWHDGRYRFDAQGRLLPAWKSCR